MKLIKKEAQKIADNYKLGRVKKVIYLSAGWVNWNYKLETDLGNYVIQILGRGWNKWKREKMQLQFRVLEFLNNRDFPYKIPSPIKNKFGRYLSRFGKRALWVYNYIKGEQKTKINKKEFQEISKALAIYHKYMNNLKEQEDFDFVDGFNYMIKQYKLLKERPSKNKLDRLFDKKADFFIQLLKKLKRINYGKQLITHSDLTPSNLLFKKGKVIGIIDFDNVLDAPRMKDISLTLSNTNYKCRSWTPEKEKIFFQAYEKILPVSKKERKLLLPILINHNCTLFWWFYDKMEKNKNRAYSLMLEIIKGTEKLNKIWKKQK